MRVLLELGILPPQEMLEDMPLEDREELLKQAMTLTILDGETWDRPWRGEEAADEDEETTAPPD